MPRSSRPTGCPPTPSDVYVIAPDSAAVGFGEQVPAGANDYVIAVRPQADKWPGVRLTADPEDPGLPGLHPRRGGRSRPRACGRTRRRRTARGC